MYLNVATARERLQRGMCLFCGIYLSFITTGQDFAPCCRTCMRFIGMKLVYVMGDPQAFAGQAGRWRVFLDSAHVAWEGTQTQALIRELLDEWLALNDTRLCNTIRLSWWRQAQEAQHA